MEGKLCLNVSELASRMGIGRNAAYELVNSENFPKLKIGKRLVVPIESLNHWLEAQASGQRAENLKAACGR